MMNEKTKKLSVLLGLIVGGFFFYLTFRKTDFNNVLKGLGEYPLIYLLWAFLSYLGFFVTRSFYLQVNMKKYGLKYGNSFVGLAKSQFYNSFLPARAGDLLRVKFFKEAQSIPLAGSLSNLFLEKILDLIFMITLLITLLAMGILTKGVVASAAPLSIIVLASILFLGSYIKFNSFYAYLASKVLPRKLFGFFKDANTKILDGLQIYSDFRQVFLSVFLLLASWGFVCLALYFVAAPYVQLLNLPIYTCLVLLIFTALSLSIPAAPGGGGTVHYGLYLGLLLLDKNVVQNNPDTISTFILIFHFLSLMLDTCIGGAANFVYYWMNTNKKLQGLDNNENPISKPT